MYVDTNEFNVAFVQVQAEYPKISRQLAESFISRLGDAVSHNRTGPVRESFGELLRQALNDSHVWGQFDREPYKVLAGKFFGRRGGHVKARKLAAVPTTEGVNRAVKKMKSKPKVQPPYPVLETNKGQLAWKI